MGRHALAAGLGLLAVPALGIMLVLVAGVLPEGEAAFGLGVFGMMLFGSVLGAWALVCPCALVLALLARRGWPVARIAPLLGAAIGAAIAIPEGLEPRSVALFAVLGALYGLCHGLILQALTGAGPVEQ